MVPTAVPSPTGAPGSVQTITIFVQGQPQTKTITVGVAPTPLPNYVTITRQAVRPRSFASRGRTHSRGSTPRH